MSGHRKVPVTLRLRLARMGLRSLHKACVAAVLRYEAGGRGLDGLDDVAASEENAAAEDHLDAVGAKTRKTMALVERLTAQVKRDAARGRA